jgi:hypothetical protein
MRPYQLKFTPEELKQFIAATPEANEPEAMNQLLKQIQLPGSDRAAGLREYQARAVIWYMSTPEGMLNIMQQIDLDQLPITQEQREQLREQIHKIQKS